MLKEATAYLSDTVPSSCVFLYTVLIIRPNTTIEI